MQPFDKGVVFLMQYCALTLKKSIMKKVIFLLMAILCLSGSSAWAQKNGYPYIKGEGDVVKEEFVLSSFEGMPAPWDQPLPEHLWLLAHPAAPWRPLHPEVRWDPSVQGRL